MALRDLDGDGEDELVVLYLAGRGTGARREELMVYDWDGETWSGHSTQAALTAVEQFNAGREMSLDLEQGLARISYNGSEVTVDLNAVYQDLDWRSASHVECALREMYYAYRLEDGFLYLSIDGEILPQGYPPTTRYCFTYTCPVFYIADGTFTVGYGELSSDYAWIPTLDPSRLTDTFRSILKDFAASCESALAEQSGAAQTLATNRFAICDLDGDGRDELITQLNATYTAGQEERIYSADGRDLFTEYPNLTYYSNGAIVAGWSHNHGRAGDRLWPYTLYRYDRQTDSYQQIAMVDGWDLRLGETYNGNPFPLSVDKDGDGFVYYIMEDEYALENPVDGPAYNEWRYTWCGGASILDIPYLPLTEENIAAFG